MGGAKSSIEKELTKKSSFLISRGFHNSMIISPIYPQILTDLNSIIFRKVNYSNQIAISTTPTTNLIFFCHLANWFYSSGRGTLTAKLTSNVGLSYSFPFRCIKGDFYVALGFSMGLALLVWVGRWSVKAGFIPFWRWA